MAKKAILAVSFGTAHDDTRKKTIDQYEKDIEIAFPDAFVYRAWTSKMLIAKLKKRDGIFIDTVEEAMQRMKEDGVTDLTVAPSHVINGIENDRMIEAVKANGDFLHSMKFSAPLLTYEEDHLAVIDALLKEYDPLEENQALVLMGHGTPHYANAIYSALNFKLKDMGHDHIYLGAVEAYPTIDVILKQIKIQNPKEVILAPFLFVAGEHAKNDMAGDDPDSWKNLLLKEGYQVRPVIKGLGESPDIRKILIDHIRKAEEQ